MTSETFTFFWHGPFSQWAPSVFTVNGLRYVNAEQFMMASKARTFGDKLSEGRIMKTWSPKAVKDLGRAVKPFNPDQWNNVCKNLVFVGNLAKFSQNPDLKRLLLETEGTTLVEASPYDKIWGIGLEADDPRAMSRSTWLGKNWLGEVLTLVRHEIIRTA